MPACRIVAVTLPPALDSAFMVSLIAATGVVNAALTRPGAFRCRDNPYTPAPGLVRLSWEIANGDARTKGSETCESA
jgi:hypothetical protein